MDTGAFSNIGGGNNVRAQAELAKKFGHATHQRRLTQPLYVSGLGIGVKKAEWEVNLPVAIENKGRQRFRPQVGGTMPRKRPEGPE